MSTAHSDVSMKPPKKKFEVDQMSRLRHMHAYIDSFICQRYSLHTLAPILCLSLPKGLFYLPQSLPLWAVSPCPLLFNSPRTGWICTCGYVRASSQPSSCSSCTISHSHRERGQIHHQNPSVQHNIEDRAADLPRRRAHLNERAEISLSDSTAFSVSREV